MNIIERIRADHNATQIAHMAEDATGASNQPAVPYTTGLEVRHNWIHKQGETACIGTAYGYVEAEQGKVVSSPEGLANAKLWAAAPILAELFFAVEAASTAFNGLTSSYDSFLMLERLEKAQDDARAAMAEVMAC